MDKKNEISVWIDHTTGEKKLRRGENCTDTELCAIALTLGYHNIFMPDKSVPEIAMELTKQCPTPFTVYTARTNCDLKNIPSERIRIGQIRVRQGDPEFALYVARNPFRVAASALGSIRSPRKAAASRANGRLGGRPRNIYKAIRSELKELGINKAVAEDITHDGEPAVMLRWNGREEIVSTTHFALGKTDLLSDADKQYITWLQSNFADGNLK